MVAPSNATVEVSVSIDSSPVIAQCDEMIECIEQGIGTLKDELASLEGRLDGWKRVREQAIEAHGPVSENGTGGGVASPAPAAPPVKKKPKRIQAKKPKGLQAASLERETAAVRRALEKLGPQVGAGRIFARVLADDNLRCSEYKLNRSIKALVEAGEVVVTGQRAGTRYTLKGSEADTRPSRAPARNEVPAPGPPLGRKIDGAAKPDARVASGDPKAEAHLALRKRIRQAMLELVTDSGPIEGGEIVTMLLEQIPEAERDDIVHVRTGLSREGAIHMHLGQGYVPRDYKPDGPDLKTSLEREIYEAIGPVRRTAREIAGSTGRDATTCRQVLDGLARRGVVSRESETGGVPMFAVAA